MSSASAGGFNPRIIAALVIAGLVGFIGYWALSAFAPEIGSGRNGGGHALSVSATGFSGIVEVMRASDTKVDVVRDATTGVPGGQDSRFGGLLILTPEQGTSPEAIVERIANVRGPVLIVLPKYLPNPDPTHRGWVMEGTLVRQPEQIVTISALGLAPVTTLSATAGGATRHSLWDEQDFTLVTPRDDMRSINGDGVDPLLSVDGRAILVEVKQRRDTYILADPDYLNNLAMADAARATSAKTLLTAIAGRGEPIAFDVTLNGLGNNGQSLLRLAFAPPFLGLTLCLMIAGLLALWQGFLRFGPAWREERNIAFGKAGLVTNSARLIVQARRVPSFALRYGAMVREAAARRLHAPAGLAGAGLDRWLDRFSDRQGQRFSTLLAALESARNPVDIVRRAAALGQWRKDVLRESD